MICHNNAYENINDANGWQISVQIIKATGGKQIHQPFNAIPR
jgi:hypothetical protein